MIWRLYTFSSLSVMGLIGSEDNNMCEIAFQCSKAPTLCCSTLNTGLQVRDKMQKCRYLDSKLNKLNWMYLQVSTHRWCWRSGGGRGTPCRRRWPAGSASGWGRPAAWRPWGRGAAAPGPGTASRAARRGSSAPGPTPGCNLTTIFLLHREKYYPAN